MPRKNNKGRNPKNDPLRGMRVLIEAMENIIEEQQKEIEELYNRVEALEEDRVVDRIPWWISQVGGN